MMTVWLYGTLSMGRTTLGLGKITYISIILTSREDVLLGWEDRLLIIQHTRID